MLIVRAFLVGHPAASTGGVAVAIGITLALIWVASIVVVMSALGAIFQTSLYKYANSGAVPAGFTADLSHAFGPREGDPMSGPVDTSPRL